MLAAGSLAAQVGLVLLLFGVPPAQRALAAVGQGVDGLAAATQSGTAFVFGYLAGGAQPFAGAGAGAAEAAKAGGAPPFLFAFRVLPVILVVCALSALLWHWRVLRWGVGAFGFVFQRLLGLRGPPALAVAATIFMGQVEGPIFIRAYLDKLTRSELFTLMAVGLSCVSGSTMVAYAALLKGALPNAAAHILTASIVSAPAGVLLARILIPPDLIDGRPVEAGAAPEPDAGRRYESSIDAVIRGVGDGLNVVLNVGATLIVFIAFAAILDRLLGLLPAWDGAPVTLGRILGVGFAPLAWSLGVPWAEAGRAGGLLGTKLVLTEFSAFIELGRLPAGVLSDRTRMIMTYALCGFANIGSVGITVAGFNVLVPERRREVVGMAWRALLAGFLATCMTAAVVGALPAALFAGR